MIVFETPMVLALIPIALIFLFIFIRINFVKFRSTAERVEFFKQRNRMRWWLFITRGTVLVLLLVALAGPATVQTKTVQGDPFLHIFTDESQSYSVYDTSVLPRLQNDIEKDIPVSISTIATLNSSPLGDSLLAQMQGDESILLVSDGRNTHGRSFGDMIFFAAQLNSTVNLLELPPVNSDAVVWIDGPGETTRDILNQFVVNVETAGSLGTYTVSVKVDGQQVLSESHRGPASIPFEQSLSEGYHEIVAELSITDTFPENNVYYKAVKVEPRPKVLFVTRESSPLEQILSNLYDLTTRSSVSGSLDQYSTVVINNLPASSIPVDSLATYASDGNGVVVIGGDNAYDKGGYENSIVESLLPATVGTGVESEERSDVNVVILIDISGTAGRFYDSGKSITVEDVEKALAIQIFEDLSEDSNVALVAFNNEPHVVAPLAQKSFQPNFVQDVERLTFGGGTVIEDALSKAREMLVQTEGSKNVILLSDGLGGSAAEELRQVRLNNLRGIKLYTVGVGPDTNTAHMEELAAFGNGVYFEPTQSERIRLLLGDVSDEEEEDVYRLEVVDGGDFITRNLRLNAVVSGFNFVVPKSNAKTLVTTSQGHPIVTSWRFGLGRIVSVTTDDGSGWSGQLLSRENSLFHSRIVNWAVGDLRRNKQFDVRMSDSNIGEDVRIEVLSQQRPTHDDFTFTQFDENLYETSFSAPSQGFHRYLNGIVGVNYPLELSQVGIDPQLPALLSLTGGEVFQVEDAEEIVKKVRTDSRKVETSLEGFRTLLIILALLVFLLEIVVRKIQENRNLNK